MTSNNPTFTQILANQVPPPLRALVRQDEPQSRRCFAVLDGVMRRGKILVEDIARPTWLAVWEPDDGTLFFGGTVDAAIVAAVISYLRRDGEVLVGLWPDDPRGALLPPAPDYVGRALEFYDRPAGASLGPILDRLPPDCRRQRLDRDLILRTEWGPGDVAAAGGLDAWEQNFLGYGLLRGDEILAEATVGPPAIGLYELGVFTQAAHRGQGYGTLVSAGLIQEIEARGGQTYWNCARQNVASAAIARKLGYRVEKGYRCVW